MLVLTLLASGLTVISAAAANAATASARLLPNPGFESSGTVPVGWEVTGSSVTMVTSPTHGGAVAARVTDTSGSTGVSLRSTRLATLPGESLTASIWANRTSGSGGALYLEFWRADGVRALAVSTPLAAASGWQQVSASGIAPEDAVTATVLAYSSLSDVDSILWDDAAVTGLLPALRKVPNEGFEQPRSGGSPTEWTVYAPGGSATVVTSPVHSGLVAVRTVDSSISSEVSVQSRQIPVAVGETVTASVWANRISGSSGVLYLEYYNSSGSRLSATTATVPAGGWRQVSATATAPSGTVGLRVRLYSLQASTGTTVWDDVTLRSTSDPSYVPALAAGATVLFVGDQRIDYYTGVSRRMNPGTKTGPVLSGTGSGTWDANPRLSGTVLPGGPGYQMWYTTSTGTGLAESVDGITWSRGDRTGPIHPQGTHGVVQNPDWAPGNGRPRFFMMRPAATGDPKPRHYYPMQSADGSVWSAVPAASPIPGWDVSNVTYDPVTDRYIAMSKQYPTNYAPPAVPPGPRTVWLSASTDFATWTAPRPSFAADLVDHRLIPAGTGNHGMTPWSEIYGMPAMRYGDQFLGTPWVFDIAYSPNRDNGDPGPDIGRSHIGLAASSDLVNWSRPNRTYLITSGPAGSWDWGFALTGTTLLNVMVGGQWQTRLYYGAFAGEHSCTVAGISAGDCTVVQGNSRIGLISWPQDRFESFHGTGTVVTRPLTPIGATLRVNYDPGTGGTLRVSVMDGQGNSVPGYTAADAIAVTGNALAPGVVVSWSGGTTLPAGPIRLKFDLTGGDLYSYTIS